MSAHLEPRSTPSSAIPGGQLEVGHPRHGAQTHSAREMTMTSSTPTPWLVVGTDKGNSLVVQVVTFARPPVPALLFVSVAVSDTGKCLFSTYLLAHLVDATAICAATPGQEVQRVAGVRYRNRMLPVDDVLDKVGWAEGLWRTGCPKPGRWRRQTSVTLDLKPEGVAFLLGPEPPSTNGEASAAVTMGGPR